MIPLPLPAGSADDEFFKGWSSERLLNMYAVPRQTPESKASYVLQSCPGFNLLTTLIEAPIRDMAVWKDRMYVIGGSKLWSVTTGGVAELAGAAIPTTGQARIVAGDQYLVVYAGGKAYWHNGSFPYAPATTWGVINDADFPTEIVSMVYVAGYWLAAERGTGAVYFSENVKDPRSWQALDFFSADGGADRVTFLGKQSNQLLVFGQETIEVWSVVPNSDLPFQRQQNTIIERGATCNGGIGDFAGHVRKIRGTHIWLGEDKRIYRLNGYTPEPISANWLEKKLQGYSDFRNAESFVMDYEGRSVYHITFPASKKTFAYDFDTGLWHERSSYGLDNYRAGSSASISGLTFVGDRTTGAIHRVDSGNYTENGDILERKFIMPIVHGSRERVFMSRLELDIQSGVGLISGQGSDPLLMMRYSDDGGVTWKGPVTRGMGKLGEHGKRVYFTRLGQFRDRVFEFSVTDPVKFNVTQPWAEITKGLH